MRKLIDVQRNGGYLKRQQKSFDFTNPGRSGISGISIVECEELTREVLESGTAGYLATLITAPNAVLAANLRTIAEFASTSPLGAHVLGVHMECFHPPIDGYRGAHPAEHCISSAAQAVERYGIIREILGRLLKIITVAPNIPGIAGTLIKQARRDGVAISLGHFGAEKEDDPKQIEEICDSIQSAIGCGAHMSTHLGNGTRPQSHRHGAHITEQLVSDELVAGLIADGIHLSDSFLRLCMKAKGPDGIYLVSDASPVAGAPEGEYSFGGNPVVVARWGKTSKVHPKGRRDIFAGSWANLLDCLNYFWRVVRRFGYDKSGFTPTVVMGLASSVPARLIGLNEHDLAALPGPDIEFRDDRFQIAPA